MFLRPAKLFCLILMATIVDGGYAFVPPHQRVLTHERGGLLLFPSSLARARPPHQSSFILSMSDKDDDDDDGHSTSPQETLQKAADDFFSSSVYRTLLFTTPFLFNPKLREIVPTPAMLVIVTAIFMYNTYEMRNSEIKDRWVPKRNAALRDLKGARADRLVSSANSADVMEAARHAYETALRKECRARVLLPSLWVIPFAADNENRNAANVFLDLDITDKCELIPLSQARDDDDE